MIRCGNKPRKRKRSRSPDLKAVPLLYKGCVKMSDPRTEMRSGAMNDCEQPAHSPVSVMGSVAKAGSSSSSSLSFSSVFDVAALALPFHRFDNDDDVDVGKKEQRVERNDLARLALAIDLNMSSMIVAISGRQAPGAYFCCLCQILTLSSSFLFVFGRLDSAKRRKRKRSPCRQRGKTR